MEHKSTLTVTSAHARRVWVNTYYQRAEKAKSERVSLDENGGGWFKFVVLYSN